MNSQYSDKKSFNYETFLQYLKTHYGKMNLLSKVFVILSVSDAKVGHFNDMNGKTDKQGFSI